MRIKVNVRNSIWIPRAVERNEKCFENAADCIFGSGSILTRQLFLCGIRVENAKNVHGVEEHADL